jgi:hypothetical protein
MPLERLRQRFTTAEEQSRYLQEGLRQHAQELAEARSAYGNALIDAQRLTRQLRQHHVATLHQNPTYAMAQDEMEGHVARMRAQLEGLVGQEEAQQVVTDQGYTPEWLQR